MKPLKFIHTLNETEPELARREYITRNVLFFTFSITSSFALISFIFYLYGKMPLDTLLIYSIESIILVVAMFFAEAGFWRVVGIIPPLLMYFPAVNANYIGGIDAPGNFMYALLIMFVAIIYGYRKMWIALVICLATYLCLAWMISSGYIKPFRTAEVVFINRVVLTSGFLVGIASMIWLLGRSYRSEIDVRIKAEELLSRKNEELGALNKALRENEELYTKLIATLPDIVVRMDLNGQILFVNDFGLHMSGYARSDVIGQSMISFIAPEDREKAIRNTMRMFEMRLGLQEYRLIMKDGRRLLFEVNGDILRNEDGSPYGLVQICRDITDRKRIEESLRISEARYELIMNNITDRIWLTDMNFKLIWASESVVRDRGYKLEEMDPFPFEKLLTPDSLETVLKTISKELTPQRLQQKDLDISKTLELEFIRKDCSTFWSEVKITVLRDHEGTPISFFGVGRDITDRKRTEEEKRVLEERLQRSEKMEALGQLAGGVAHDLNNVLGVLSGYSELLLLEIPKGHRSRGHAEKILQSTEKGAAIIDDLLTLARRSVVVSDVINLNSVVSGFLKTPVFESMKDYHPRVTFRTEYDKNLLNIKGSPVHLEKTLMNLISNAAESTSGTGEVTIRTEGRYLDKPLQGYDEVNEGDYAVLTVSDTGIGIPAENREKIFEPFYTKKTMGRSGTGLGLAIVWGTVKDHNGYIDVQSKMGEGTTFTLFFPVTREEMVLPQQKETMERYMGKGESVLVVDDVAEQRDVAAGLLTRLGYHVRVVSSGEEAVEYLKSNKADILILDMIMAPGIDGLETYQRVLAINPKQKAIIVSGFSETERVKAAQKLGAGAYVKKPYIMEKIGVAIREELDRK